MSGTDELIRGLARKLEAEFWPEGSAAHQAQDKFERVLRESGLAEVIEVLVPFAALNEEFKVATDEFSSPTHVSCFMSRMEVARAAAALDVLCSKVVPQ